MPADPKGSGVLGALLTNEAVALAAQRNFASALPLIEKAISLLTPLCTSATAGRVARERLSEALWQSARIQLALNQPEIAADIEAKRRELWKGIPASELAKLALREIDRATLIAHGKVPISEPGKVVRDIDLDLAAADLRLAIENGFRDLAVLKADRDFAVMQGNDGLRELIKRLTPLDGINKP